MRLLEENARLRAENAGLGEEIARLKGLKGRPKIKPSGMEKKAAERRKTKERRQQARRGKKNAQLRIDEECTLVAEVSPGSRFKGTEVYVVQDLLVRPQPRRYHRQRWLTPSGETVIAALPAGVAWHRGEARVCSMVRVPSVEEEDARQLTRGRESLLKEHVRDTNRIKGLVAGQGIYDFEPLGADLMRDLAETAHE